jgi:hypothetical protein
MPDAEVARRTGRTIQSARRRRLHLGIPYLVPERQRWTEEQDKLLGKLPDAEVARHTGHSVAAVAIRRSHRGLRDPCRRRFWSPEETSRLGTAPDADIARQFNRTLSAVKSRREGLKILAWGSRH